MSDRTALWSRLTLRPLAAALAGEGDRLWLWLPVAFGLGIGGYFALMTEPPIWAGPLAVAISAMLAYRFRSGRLSLVWVMLCFVAAGFSAASYRTHSLDTRVLTDEIGPAGIEGRVLEIETLPKGYRLTLERLRVRGLSLPDTPDRVRLRAHRLPEGLDLGAWVEAYGVLRPPPPPSAPGAFDFQRHAYFQGLGGVGFVLGEVRLTRPPDETGWRDAVVSLRHRVAAEVRDRLPGTTGAVAAALMTGERRAIPEATLDAMRDSGLAHLLAISGLHVGLVAGAVFFALRALLALVPALALRYPIKKAAALAALSAAGGYTLLAGASVPTVRAFLMVGIVLVGVMLDRRGLSLRSLAWAALAILAIWPESLLGPSFQMSFAAVAALVAAYEAWAARKDRGERAGSRGLATKALIYLAGVGATTVIAGLATAPFAVYHFNRVAEFGLIANLAAVPITALWVMPVAVLAFVLMPFGLAGPALTLMGWGIDRVLQVAEAVSAWPGAVALVPAMPTALLVTATLGGLWLCLMRARWRWWGAVPLVAAFGLIPLQPKPDLLVDGEARLVATRALDGGYRVSALNTKRFEREIWLARAGLDAETGLGRWPAPGSGLSRESGLACDAMGCVYTRRGRRISIVRDPGALLEDCGLADLVIALVPLRGRCRGSVAIGRFDLWREGAHAIWIGNKGITVRSVAETRGKRPWVVERGGVKGRLNKRGTGDSEG